MSYFLRLHSSAVLQLLAALLVAAGLVGCNVERVNRNEHQAAREREVRMGEPAAPSQVAGALVSTEDLAEQVRLLSVGSTEQKIAIAESLAPRLGQDLYSKERLQGPGLVSDPANRKKLEALNLSLLVLAEHRPGATTTDHLASYFAAVSTGCDSQYFGCVALPFFRTIQSSSAVLAAYARTLETQVAAERGTSVAQRTTPSATATPASRPQALNNSVARLYRVLGLAISVNNGMRNTEIEYIYLRNARFYADWFRAQSDPLPPEFTLHGKVFQQIVENFQPRQDDPRFVEFVSSFNPWAYSRLARDPFPFGTQRMFSFAASMLMYEAGKPGVLNQQFRNAIHQSREQEDVTGPGFYWVVKMFQSAPKLKPVVLGLGLNLEELHAESFYSEYFFMVDRLYRGHITVADARELWAKSTQDGKNLADTVNAYMRLMTAKLIVETNAGILEQAQKPNLHGEILVRNVVNESVVLARKWEELQSAFEGRVQDFLGQTMRNNEINAGLLEGTSSLIRGLRRNAKYLAVYPSMILMSYYIYDLSGTLEIMTFWGPVKIDANTIIPAFFAGMLNPLFNFGNDGVALTNIEILYAFYFALAGGVFDTLAEKTGQGVFEKPTERTASAAPVSNPVTRTAFFEKVIRKYLAADVQALESVASALDAASGNAQRNNLLKICQDLRNGSPFVRSLSLDEFRSGALITASEQEVLLGSYLALAKDSGAQGEGSALVRQLERKLAYLRIVSEAVSENMRKIGKAEAEFKDVEAAVRKEIEKGQALIARVYSAAISQHREISGCIGTLQLAERKRQEELLQAEIRHLSGVYQFMVRNRALTDAQRLALLNTKAEGSSQTNAEILGVDPKLDSIRAEAYISNRLSFYLRMGRVQRQLSPRVEIGFENLDLEASAERTLVNTINLVRQAEGQARVGEADFIRQGLSMFTDVNLAGTGRVPTWLSNRTKWVSVNQSIVESLGSLYVMGRSQGGIDQRVRPVEAQEILDARYAQYVVHSIGGSDDQEVLRALGLRSYLDFRSLQSLGFDDSLQPEAMFDGIVKRLSDAPVVIQGEALAAASIVRRRSQFLFEPSLQFKSSILTQYKPILSYHEVALDQLLAEIAALQTKTDKGELTFSQVRLRVDSSGTVIAGPRLAAGSGRALLLSDEARQNAKGRWTEFHLNTGQCFKNAQCEGAIESGAEAERIEQAERNARVAAQRGATTRPAAATASNGQRPARQGSGGSQ